MERRAFLNAALAAPAAAIQGRGAAAPRPAAATHASFDPWIEINAAHLRANAAAVHALARVPVLAVIKNNGYGAGVVNVARLLEPLGSISGFAVVKLNEAITLRDAGVRKPILLMGPVATSEIRAAAERDIALMVYTPILRDLGRVSNQLRRPLDVHICIDTGLGRVGIPHTEATPYLRDLGRSGFVTIRGVMMTFTEDEAFDREQLLRFRDLTMDAESVGIVLGRKHAASSYTLFQHTDAFLDQVRPGMALYGIYPEAKFRKTGLLALTPALALKTRVAYVKQLQAGDSAGYNRAYMAKRPVWIATLPVGHADGLPRIAANGGRVRINGALYPIVASISASHTIVELGERRAEIGDEATIFDWTEGSRPEDLADSCGASVYDLTMHLNPLLPRTVIAT